MASHHTVPSTKSGRELSPACVQEEKRPCLQSSHVIFELDGVLLDTEALTEQAYANACRRFGKEMTTEARLQRMGANELEGVQATIRLLDLPCSLEEMVRLTNDEVRERLPQCQLMPGAERLVRHLHSQNVPMAIATSNKQEFLDAKLSSYPEFRSLFHHIVCGSSDPEVKQGKPAPDIFLVTASRFPDRPPPSKVLVFENSVTGVHGARAAGMHVLALSSPLVHPQMLSGASLVLDSLTNFRPEHYGFLPF